jgi:hypothetical protein
MSSLHILFNVSELGDQHFVHVGYPALRDSSPPANSH